MQLLCIYLPTECYIFSNSIFFFAVTLTPIQQDRNRDMTDNYCLYQVYVYFFALQFLILNVMQSSHIITCHGETE